MSFSSFLGGSSDDKIASIAVAADGSSYVTGYTSSDDFPTLNAFNDTKGSTYTDAFIAKFSVNGSLLWSTYLGGSQHDRSKDIAVDGDGNCYVTGDTYSNDFPTLNAYNDTLSGFNDVFISKFSSSGTLLWSTYLGGAGNDDGYAIAVDNAGKCYVTGETCSSNFPVLNAYDDTLASSPPEDDAFIAKFSSSGNLLWSTYLGGSEQDTGFDIALDGYGRCFAIGRTDSADFPTYDAYCDTYSGKDDVFITKFSSDGLLLWSTYFGGSGRDWGNGIAIAKDDSCYVTGETNSTNFPTLNAYNDTLSSTWQTAFVSKFTASGSLLWSTYLGGSKEDTGNAIAVDSSENCYVTGRTYSEDFPTLNAYDSTFNSAGDTFSTKFSDNGSLIWSTYLGGTNYEVAESIAVSDDDHCYVVGRTSSNDFPLMNAYDTKLNGTSDGFITVFKTSYSSQSTTSPSPSYGFLAFIFATPILFLISKKKRKR
ncbi:MAG: SBBP repeat-containing protein [Candidatus Heimdallarchaeota archaeon]